MKKEKVLLSWSGGKDSVVSLFELKSPEYKIEGLLTTVVRTEGRVKMHNVREDILQSQADSLELPLIKVIVSENATNEEYETALAGALVPFQKKGVKAIAFGDLFLEDVKAYRDELGKRLSFKPVYPIWNWKVDEVLRVFFGLGYKGVVTCIDKKKLPLSFVGRAFDREFVKSLPSNIDPCGENGEFHTFVYDGPFFQKTIKLEALERFEKGDFAFQDFRLSS